MDRVGDQQSTLLETIRDAVYVLDPEGYITYVNNAALDEVDIGYERDDLLGTHVSNLLSEDDIEKCTALIEEILKNSDQDTGRCEIDIISADDEVLPCELQITVLLSDVGEFDGTVGVVRDISTRKRREQRTQVFYRILRHNLRNHMNVILGRAELLEGEFPAETDAHVQAIRRNAEELMELSEKVRRILQLNEEPSSNHSIDVGSELRSLLSEVRSTYPDATVEIEGPTEVHASVASREMFEVAMRNLIENAIEHNTNANPRVTVRLSSCPHQASIQVEDNGAGLPEIERDVIRSGSESPLQHSSGIGLWIVYWTVQASNGEFSIDNSSEGGTVVTASFPLGDTNAERGYTDALYDHV